MKIICMNERDEIVQVADDVPDSMGQRDLWTDPRGRKWFITGEAQFESGVERVIALYAYGP